VCVDLSWGQQKVTAQIGSSLAIMKSDPKTIKTLYPTTRGTVNRKKDGELEDGRSVHSMSICVAIRSASSRAQ